MARHPSRSFALASLCGRRGSQSRACITSTGCSPCSTVRTPAASRLCSARRPMPCPRGCARWILTSRASGHRGAPSLGVAPGGRHHASPVPAARGGGHPGDRREVRQPPRDHRLPGRQRARPVPAAQPARVRRVPALARRPLRGCRDAQPRVGADVLVAARSAAGTSSGVPMATTRRSTSSSGAATRPSSSPTSSRGRPASCASTRIPASS